MLGLWWRFVDWLRFSEVRQLKFDIECVKYTDNPNLWDAIRRLEDRLAALEEKPTPDGSHGPERLNPRRRL